MDSSAGFRQSFTPWWNKRATELRDARAEARRVSALVLAPTATRRRRPKALSLLQAVSTVPGPVAFVTLATGEVVAHVG